MRQLLRCAEFLAIVPQACDAEEVAARVRGLGVSSLVRPLDMGPELIAAMRAMVFPLTTREAKGLFRLYCKTRGPLARQAGESMTQYVSRRKRCWKLLKELDPEIELSEGHRADMLLDLSGLDRSGIDLSGLDLPRLDLL